MKAQRLLSGISAREYQRETCSSHTTMPLKFQLGIVDQGHLSAKCGDLGVTMFGFLIGVTWEGRGLHVGVS